MVSVPVEQSVGQIEVHEETGRIRQGGAFRGGSRRAGQTQRQDDAQSQRQQQPRISHSQFCI